MAQSDRYVSEEFDNQRIEEIPLDKLVLWSENPRDPIDPHADNEAVIQNALHGSRAQDSWKINDLAKEMGRSYDYSELPTVIYDEESDRYVVLDGNRRVILALLIRDGRVPGQAQMPLFPKTTLPCNVRDRDGAFQAVFRKHSKVGTWRIYERDVFCHRYMGEDKSVLVKLEEWVGAISSHEAELNQRYVRDDVLNRKHLRELGLDPDAEYFGLPKELLGEFVDAVAQAIAEKRLYTRKDGRNNPACVLDPDLLARLSGHTAAERPDDEAGEQKPLFGAGVGASFGFPPNPCGAGSSGSGSCEPDTCGEPPARSGVGAGKTPSSNPAPPAVFGGPLRLRYGDVNDLYRTLDELWGMYEKGRIGQASGFVGLFRAGLRLLAETAAKECFPGDKRALDDYVGAYRDKAKSAMRLSGSDDAVTYLANNSVTGDNLCGLLHTGAHGYSSSKSCDQARALSIYLGEMLKLSHGNG